MIQANAAGQFADHHSVFFGFFFTAVQQNYYVNIGFRGKVASGV